MSMPGWTDAHAHPLEWADPAEAERRAGRFGVRRVLGNSTHPREWKALGTLAASHPWILPQFGVHPWRVEDLPGDWEERLTTMLLRFPRAGLGETGLDSRLADAPMERQVEVFRRQLRIARKLDRPCTLHVVGAWNELEYVLKEGRPLRMLLHGFGGSAEQVAVYARRPVWFSFGGAVIRHADSRKLGNALRAVPENRLLLETDAPYQHPDGGDSVQEPAGLLRIAEAVAEIRGVPVDRLRRRTEANMATFLGED